MKNQEILFQKTKAWMERCPHNVTEQFKRNLYAVTSKPINETPEALNAFALLEELTYRSPVHHQSPYSKLSCLTISVAVGVLARYAMDPAVRTIENMPTTLEIKANVARLIEESEPEVDPDSIEIKL